MSQNSRIGTLPQPIQKQLLWIASEQDKKDDGDFIDALAGVWEKKAALFLDQIKAVNLELVDSVSKDDMRGMMVLTYSGSLLSIGPVFQTATNVNNGRWVEYSSIKLRTDVPDIVSEWEAVLAADFGVDKPVKLENARVKATSPTYLIAVCPPNLDEEEQDKRIRESAIYVTTGFMKYNRTLQIDKSNVPDQFTMKSMTRYLAKKHNMTGQEAKLLLDDFVTLIETGMLLGESVPVGRLGRFSVKTRGVQKARVVKHPGTGEEMTIDAKPAMGVPKISFSTYLKERAASVTGIDGDEDDGD